MRLDRETLFSYCRRAPFGGRLTQQQVDGVGAILDAWLARAPRSGKRGLAYALATAFHETGGTFAPVRETFAKTDAEARRKLAKKAYGKPDARTGQVYYGRGLVQLTWADNYKTLGNQLGVDLYRNPDRALDLKTAARILVAGMASGAFTGKSLDDYFGDEADDPRGARRIVNGTDKASLIAGYHKNFLDALDAAEAAVNAGTPIDVTPVMSKADGADLSTDKTVWGAIVAGGGGLAGTVVAAVNNPWALGAVAIIALGVFLVLTGRVSIKRTAGA